MNISASKAVIRPLAAGAASQRSQGLIWATSGYSGDKSAGGNRLMKKQKLKLRLMMRGRFSFRPGMIYLL